MDNTINSSIKKIAVALGVSDFSGCEIASDYLEKVAGHYGVTVFSSNDTVADVCDKIAGGIVFGGSNPVTVAASDAEAYWGTNVSDMQSDIVVSGGKITGTLKYLSEGQLVKDWGEGYFIALKFTKNNAAATSIKVGLKPSVSSGLVELDADMDAVIKITDKERQVFVVLCSNGSVFFEQHYDLSELTLEEPE